MMTAQRARCSTGGALSTTVSASAALLMPSVVSCVLSRPPSPPVRHVTPSHLPQTLYCVSLRVAWLTQRDPGEVPVCQLCEDRPPMERNRLRGLLGPASEEWAAFKRIEMRNFIDQGIGGGAAAAGSDGGGGGGSGALNLIACPGNDCSNFMVLDQPGVKFECRCNQDGGCGLSFCSLCRDSPYHRHGTTCEQARAIRYAWDQWIATGRAEFYARLGQKAATANAAAAQAASERLAQVQADEQWKAANCRHCPHCQRVVRQIIPMFFTPRP